MIELEKEIKKLEELKKKMKEKDINHIWEYFDPNPPVSKYELSQLQTMKKEFDKEIINFWQIHNGWNCFYQMVDLFGTSDIYSEKMDYANKILKIEIENQNEFTDKQLIPIAVSRDDMDIFVYVKEGICKGKIIWYAGGEIERFDSFIHFFDCMIEYCKADFDDLCNY